MFNKCDYRLIGYNIYNGKTISEDEMFETYYGMVSIIRTLNASANITNVRYTFEKVV